MADRTHMIDGGQFASSPSACRKRSRLVPAGTVRPVHWINAMRSFLALGLLITLCASASAAPVHHLKRDMSNV